MAVTSDGHSNGNGIIDGHHHSHGHSHTDTDTDTDTLYPRFSDIPSVIDIPVRGEDGDEAVNLDLTDLLDDTDELCDLLQNENAARIYWVTISLAYAKQGKVETAIEMLRKGLEAQARGRSEDRLLMLCCLCWMYLWQCRRAPRIRPSLPPPSADQHHHQQRTKEQFLHSATQCLNDASRINPSYPPLFLARGTLYLLRASIQPSAKSGGSTSAGGPGADRTETLKQAAKCFDDAYKLSGQKNLLAMLGKAKAQFSLSRYAEALAIYQHILSSAPDLTDPDPRIGIACCLWSLGHKALAKSAWERSLQVKPERNIAAHILLALAYLDESSQHESSSPDFQSLYKKAMTDHTQTAFKIDPMHPLTCATFASYFLLRKQWANVERLARRALEQTDVNAVASDGWYLLARQEHSKGEDLAKAAEYYAKADQARGGEEKGYLPAKFGAAQLRTLMGDLNGAKFRLDKIVSNSAGGQAQQQKSLEAMTLLGILYAEDVFVHQSTGGKAEERRDEQRKAIALLEHVRVAWKDAKRKLSPDAAVLLNLARLYETEAPERALACLQQVEQMELSEIQDDDERLPEDVGDETEERRVRRELLSPQLLNNIGCFHFQAEKYSIAREDFQAALNSCVKMSGRESSIDTDALVTIISYNLARTYEAEGLTEESQKIYQGLLERHPDYTDANARMAYVSINASPEQGERAIMDLLAADPSNLDVRALYGYYLSRTKKRTMNLPEDVEQKHYKETLQRHDKHDLYSLIGMGNLHLQVAREMRRETDQDKERRAKTYMRAVEFFDKALTLDPRNAFAAQGLGIAVVEDKKDTQAAIQIFSKVRESLKGVSGSVHLNLGHVFAEVRQWSRSIENYELALQRSVKEGRDGRPDSAVLACLGRVWLMRGRQEKNFEAYRTALDLSKQALELRPRDINLRFNVAFVQIQLAQLVISLPEAQKTLVDVEEAGTGLDEAIEVFTEIAKGPTPPFPRGDLEARANMGRNTMKRQLTSASAKQAEYERKNASRLEEARKRREAEIVKREEGKRLAAERADEERQKIKAERERMAEEDRELIKRREDEEKAREEAEYDEDPETGERKKREKKPKARREKRKKKTEEDTDTDGVADGTDGEDGGRKGRRSRAASTPATGSDGEPRRTKKRRLEKKGHAVKSSGKYKSAEKVVESDGEKGREGNAASMPPEETSAAETPVGDEMDLGDDEEEEETVARPRKKAARVLDDDEDAEEDAVPRNAEAAAESDHGGE